VPDELERIGGQVEALPHQFSDAHDGVRLAVAGPERNPVVLGPHAHDDPRDSVYHFGVFVLSDHHHCQFDERRVELLSPLVVQTVGPLSPVAVGRVLPHGLDARTEQVVVAASLELARVLYVVEEAPKIFNGVESGNLHE